MKSILYYFTGTGNSLKTARDIAQQLENCQILPIMICPKFNRSMSNKNLKEIKKKQIDYMQQDQAKQQAFGNYQLNFIQAKECSQTN